MVERLWSWCATWWPQLLIYKGHIQRAPSFSPTLKSSVCTREDWGRGSHQFGVFKLPKLGWNLCCKDLQGHSRASEQIIFADGKMIWDSGLTHLSRPCVLAVPAGGVVSLGSADTGAGLSLWGLPLTPTHSVRSNHHRCPQTWPSVSWRAKLPPAENPASVRCIFFLVASWDLIWVEFYSLACRKDLLTVEMERTEPS